ncbi:sigma-70 family RNA polymerase sigma factor [Herminiimonas fonticola]|uniref:RNA polymerase sigma-70 factor (ECF subfamily) n=1 Tax=Herminiimonas fonticola TaxID=303380 RepID=A0A4R6G7N4_9BURK|nr:sigma-70 family RNA polymerase sigma factor [Herminiimonas fonticola]RBA23774.1 sigma70-ECF: RNA polymerase sigma factor, sigma-70 family [Herminiimonas fonticola]TDN89775.1 RNA polymerase sigma-70 factor (ECF subfamily) [Herminiimonas fonticola]
MPADSDSFDYNAALHACALGDEQALKRIYLQDSKRLLGVALRIVRQRHLAEDVLHDAFVNIWNKAVSFDATRGEGRGWIYSVVRHQALNMLRDRDREVYADEEAIDNMQQQNEELIVDQFELNANLGQLQDCLSHLDSAKRNSILCAYVDGCSHSEIAQRLNAPLGSVKAWVKRGLAALRECMG